MEEDYVSLETAKLLKEKGFNVPICTYYFTVNNNELNFAFESNWNNTWEHAYSAPTLWDAMKWLRNYHHLHIIPEISDPSQLNPKYYVVIWDTTPKRKSYILDLFDSYEEACEEGIKYCLENLINNEQNIE